MEYYSGMKKKPQSTDACNDLSESHIIVSKIASLKGDELYESIYIHFDMTEF